MSEHASRRRPRMAEFGKGTRDVAPIVLGALPFGVLFGALAAQVGFSWVLVAVVVGIAVGVLSERWLPG
ncbi:hypothetical protein GCM10009609_75080 [Pseudonocardia aurantiaca]